MRKSPLLNKTLWWNRIYTWHTPLPSVPAGRHTKGTPSWFSSAATFPWQLQVKACDVHAQKKIEFCHDREQPSPDKIAVASWPWCLLILIKTDNAQAPSLFSNVTLTSRRSLVLRWKRGRELVHCLYKKLQTCLPTSRRPAKPYKTDKINQCHVLCSASFFSHSYEENSLWT